MGFTTIRMFEVRNTMEDEELFHYWHKHYRSESHQHIPKGLKLVKRSFSLNYLTI